MGFVIGPAAISEVGAQWNPEESRFRPRARRQRPAPAVSRRGTSGGGPRGPTPVSSVGTFGQPSRWMVS
eukprot:8186687-Alexandrium_andersonii.AAC.1